MNEIKNISKNSVFYFISTLSRLVSNVVIFLLIARHYGPQLFGSFSSAHTLSMLYLLIADFGFDLLLTTEIAKNRENVSEIVNRFVPSKMVLIIISCLLLLLSGYLMHVNNETKILIYFFSLYMVFSTLSNLFYSIFKGLENFKYEAKNSIFSNITALLATLIFTLLNLDIVFVVAGLIFSRLIALILAVRQFKKTQNKITFSFSFIGLKKDFRIISIYGIHLLFGSLFFQIDSILLVSIKGEYEAGLYQALFRILTITLVIVDVLIGVSLPTLAKNYISEHDNCYKYGKVLFKIILSIGFAIAVILFSKGSDLVQLLLGINYIKIAPLMKYAAFIIFFRFLAEPFAMFLTIEGKQKIRMLIVVFVFILNLCLNLIFIPRYGIYAAIWVSLLSNAFAGILYIFFMLKILSFWFEKLWYVNLIGLTFIFYIFLDIMKFKTSLFLLPILLLLYLFIAYNICLSKSEKNILLNIAD